MKRTLVIIMAAAMLLVLLPATALAAVTTWNVDTDAELASALANAAAGDTINISNGNYTLAPGTVIDENLTIMGESESGVKVTPSGSTGSSGNARGWIIVTDGVVFNLCNLTMDGTGFNIFQAVRAFGEVNAENVTMCNIKYPTYNGVGFALLGGGSVINVTMYEIGREGILVFGGAVRHDMVIDGLKYAGKGTGDWLDYAIEVGGGNPAAFQVDVSNTTISGCLGVASIDDSTSAGILITTYYSVNLDPDFLTINIDHVNIRNCTVGVCAGYTDEVYELSQTTVTNSNFFNDQFDLAFTGKAPGSGSLTVSGNYYGGDAPVTDVSAGLTITGLDNYSTTPIPQSQDTEVKAGVDPTYTIVIPASVDFGTLVKGTGNITREFDVTAQNVLIEADAEIEVSVASLTAMTDESGTGSLAYVLRNETAPVSTGLFATFEGNDTEDGTVTVNTNNILIAGSYKGTMVFAISYE